MNLNQLAVRIRSTEAAVCSKEVSGHGETWQNLCFLASYERKTPKGWLTYVATAGSSVFNGHRMEEVDFW